MLLEAIFDYLSAKLQDERMKMFLDFLYNLFCSVCCLRVYHRYITGWFFVNSFFFKDF